MSQYAKAVAALCTAATGALVTAASDGSVTLIEGIIVGLTALGAGAATWAVPNSGGTEYGES